jgi:ActR/RegA family two-component response regulator
VAKAKILLVDDDRIVLCAVGGVLTKRGFDVVLAESVPEALKLITSEPFDVLVSDLHMPGTGDGLTVVGAMRHANPKAHTLLLTAFPAMDAAARAVVRHADEILVKPMDVDALTEVIEERLASGPPRPRVVETVAQVLERSMGVTIEDWFDEVQKEKSLMAIPMSFDQRCGHLPLILRDLVSRLESPETLGTHAHPSASAARHGRDRKLQGYTPAMMVEESRRLQVSIFRTLQNNLANIDFRRVLLSVMTIADEVDSQLSQAMESYLAESLSEPTTTAIGRVS